MNSNILFWSPCQSVDSSSISRVFGSKPEGSAMQYLQLYDLLTKFQVGKKIQQKQMEPQKKNN